MVQDGERAKLNVRIGFIATAGIHSFAIGDRFSTRRWELTMQAVENAVLTCYSLFTMFFFTDGSGLFKVVPPNLYIIYESTF